MPLIPFLLPLELDLDSFRAIIWCRDFLEPRMLQRLLRRDALPWVVDEDAAEEVKEVSAEVVVAWYYVLEFVSDVSWIKRLHSITCNFFIAFTNLLDALVVSAVG